MVPATQIRRGMVVKIEGTSYVVVDYEHIAPGNWRAMVQVKLRDMKTGSTTQKRLRAEDRVEHLFTENKPMEYLYSEAAGHVFMDQQSYDQITLAGDIVGDTTKYLIPNTEVKILFCEGKPVSMELPSSVVMAVKETMPGEKGNTVNNTYKPATLETGVEVKVPLFINVGDKVKVDTRTGEFLERASQG